MRIVKYSILLLTVALISVGNSQPGMGYGPPGGPPMGRDRMPEKIKTIKIWQLTEAVELTSGQSEKFFPIYNELEKNLKELDRKKFDIMKKMDELSDGNGDSDSEIKKNIELLGSLETQKLDLKEKFIQDISGILSMKQVAKLMVFEERFKRRLREIIQDIRQERGGKYRRRQ